MAGIAARHDLRRTTPSALNPAGDLLSLGEKPLVAEPGQAASASAEYDPSFTPNGHADLNSPLAYVGLATLRQRSSGWDRLQAMPSTWRTLQRTRDAGQTDSLYRQPNVTDAGGPRHTWPTVTERTRSWEPMPRAGRGIRRSSKGAAQMACLRGLLQDLARCPGRRWGRIGESKINSALDSKPPNCSPERMRKWPLILAIFSPIPFVVSFQWVFLSYCPEYAAFAVQSLAVIVTSCAVIVAVLGHYIRSLFDPISLELAPCEIRNDFLDDYSVRRDFSQGLNVIKQCYCERLRVWW